jgi:hypothetical protein
MDNGPLGMMWQVTVAKEYKRVTWQPGIVVKSHNKGLFMSERGEGLTTVMGWDTTREQVEQVASVDDDVPE